jgi:PEP-CTERM motif-containing protein
MPTNGKLREKRFFFKQVLVRTTRKRGGPMIRNISACVVSITFSGLLQAAIVNTNDPAVVSAFQSGATVVNFESISGRTAQTITSYTSGNPVSASAFIFDQIPGVQFSVGGMVGTNEPALYSLSGGIAGNAHSPTTVLGPVDFDFTTKFNSGSMIEIFFPTKVSEVGFWLNPALGNVELIAADTNFAFSHLTETTLETANPVTAGNFVGIQRPTADIGGFKIIGLGTNGFTVDDFTFGGGTVTSSVPEPGALGLLACGLIGLLSLRRRHKSAGD